ncbi:alpha/beta hydrolase [bacterium]|nr:alpha/beta hydrolase [bacterium]
MANTRLEVHYDAGFGNQIFVRGQGPFQWGNGELLQSEGSDRWILDFDLPGPRRAKVLVNDEEWSVGENYLLQPGMVNEIYPNFTRSNGGWEPFRTFHFEGDSVRTWVYTPPGYDRNLSKRYPALYHHDGQTVFDDSLTLAGSKAGVELRLDETLDGLILNGMMDDILVVAVEARAASSKRHIDYTPSFDVEEGGGGEAGAYLGFLVNEIKPAVDDHYRTLPDQNGIMGSSLAGLFAFYAGRVLPQVFQRVACMSSSFWWAQSEIIRQVEISDAHYPQKIYMDAGQGSESEADAADKMFQLEHALWKDGYRYGVDMLTRLFPPHSHHAWFWRQRTDAPLSFLYPWQDGL